MLRTTFMLFLILMPCTVYGQTNLYAGAWSMHADSHFDYNESHKLIAAERNRWIAGYFENSIYNDTFFAGRTISKSYGDVELGVIVGAMYGYTRCIGGQKLDGDKRVCPMIVPSVSYTESWVEPTAYLMGNALAVGVRFEL